jgi:hypothetical protein
LGKKIDKLFRAFPRKGNLEFVKNSYGGTPAEGKGKKAAATKSWLCAQ